MPEVEEGTDDLMGEMVGKSVHFECPACDARIKVQYRKRQFNKHTIEVVHERGCRWPAGHNDFVPLLRVRVWKKCS